MDQTKGGSEIPPLASNQFTADRADSIVSGSAPDVPLRCHPIVTTMNPNAPTEARHDVRWTVGRESRLWLIGLALAAPAWIPYVSHFVAPSPGRLPTGFISYDMPYYLANAREHFDGGRFQTLYSNPFDFRYDAPAIYFQPMTLALAGILQGTHLDPGLVLVGFEVVAAWLCARVGLSLYFEVVGIGGRARGVGLLAFFWGGGLLAIAGIGYSLVKRGVIANIFQFDPAGGWWFLNFGRNLIFPTEALYHALFFGSVLCLLRDRFASALALALVVSASHPFTGIELLLILATWSALELFFVRSSAVPRLFFFGVVALLVLHVGYYLGYLGRFPEHVKLMKAWTVAWELEAVHFLPAYSLVGALAFWSFRRLDLARQFFDQPRNRLFLTWFAVAFALANHEFAFRPIQPLHFTRGYIWTPLFFLGAMPLITVFARCERPARYKLRTAAIAATLTLFSLDNILWLGQFPLAAAQGRQFSGFFVKPTQLDLYRWLARDENRGATLLALDPELGYLASVYTPLRSWIGHEYNTPDLDKRKEEIASFFNEGRIADAWKGKTLIVAVDRTAPESQLPPQGGTRPVYQNPGYLVYRLEPIR